jgi:hypothetical protein
LEIKNWGSQAWLVMDTDVKARAMKAEENEKGRHSLLSLKLGEMELGKST